MPDWAGDGDESVDAAVGEVSAAADARPLSAQVGPGEAGTGVTEDFACEARDEAAPTRGAFER